MFKLIEYIYKLGESSNKILKFFFIVFVLFISWCGIHLEMWLYENIVINAMGASLNPISFWEMVGFDLFCWLLTGSLNINKE